MLYTSFLVGGCLYTRDSLSFDKETRPRKRAGPGFLERGEKQMQRAISFSDSICQNLYISILRETIHSESHRLSHPPHPPNSRFIFIFLKWIFQLPQKPEPLFISWEKSVGVERAQAPRMLCPQQGPQGRALAVSNLAKRPLSGSSSHFQ